MRMRHWLRSEVAVDLSIVVHGELHVVVLDDVSEAASARGVRSEGRLMESFVCGKPRRGRDGKAKPSNEDGDAPGAGGTVGLRELGESRWLEDDDSCCSVSAGAPLR